MASLERYAASRDSMRFSKEASYKARFASSRLAERDEAAFFDIASEFAKPSFLRRKTEMGKDSRKTDE
jgi:hypothetical protein